MDPITDAVQATEPAAIAMTPPKGAPDQLSARGAAALLSKLRQDKPKDQSTTTASERAPPASAGPGAPAGEPSQQSAAGLAPEAGAAPASPGPGETEALDPATPGLDPEVPSIEPPRSWTKDDKELFTSLPRATQERIAERERSRDTDLSRRQNEAAVERKALAAERQHADQVRQHYESALPQLLQALQAQEADAFADIKTMADVERLTHEDWPRYMQWDVAQKKIAMATQQMLDAYQRQAQQRSQHFSGYAKREDELFVEKVPDLADPKKAAELQSAAVSVLKDLGFEEGELAQSWQGAKALSLRDHRVQLLIREATLWREAQQKARAAAAKPVPPVQRPGVSQPKGAAQEAQIANLNKQLENASGVNALRLAARLTAAKRATR
jgi:hypothetical protein